jgi:hypothetical protein
MNHGNLTEFLWKPIHVFIFDALTDGGLSNLLRFVTRSFHLSEAKRKT